MQRIIMLANNRVTEWMMTEREQDGQALAEYALILMFIALVCVAAVTLLGIPIKGFYTTMSEKF